MPDPTSLEALERRIDELAREVRDQSQVVAQVVPLLMRIAEAIEALAARGGIAPADSTRSFREALDAGDWDEVDRIRFRPGVDPATADGWAGEVERAQDRARVSLRAEIDAAVAANDPSGVLDRRDRLTRLLDGETARQLDRDLVRWLMGLIQKRLRGGKIGPDVVALASAVADRFAATPEGASLRVALPTLRRSVGLCPRCGAPHLGDEDECPECRKVTTPTASSDTPGVQSEPDPSSAWGEEPDDDIRPPVDLNSDEVWETG